MQYFVLLVTFASCWSSGLCSFISLASFFSSIIVCFLHSYQLFSISELVLFLFPIFFHALCLCLIFCTVSIFLPFAVFFVSSSCSLFYWLHHFPLFHLFIWFLYSYFFSCYTFCTCCGLTFILCFVVLYIFYCNIFSFIISLFVGIFATAISIDLWFIYLHW